MSNFNQMYREIVKGLYKYESPKLTVEGMMKQLELEENYDKLDSLEKAHKVNSYVADVKGDTYYYDNEDRSFKDQLALDRQEAIDITFDRSTYKTNPSRFNVQAILGLDKLNIM